ncbi:two-component system, NarL family, capsular synthesis sensor histidine kinase RcsC [Pseudomonas delhiensis]|uniref:histidine kinase n=2 Tax=Pseudomonas delhiensis TaxID=366289 RepID=A0A239N4K0_9PSED|nr:two-component system, NarL family, capsular synthesis sensor histidine kinase RcsC [Pseudomonas delhiensis]SNT49099.1 two-component system, NarL family, capsular synthesis sensor histidine kinase RcsC [Pseudomonas delhiensis]
MCEANGTMEHDDGSIGKLARTSQRLNLWLFGLLLLSLALVGISFWAIKRVLQEEQDKIDFHFARLLGDIREHEAFLQRIARQSDEATRRRDQDVVPLQLTLQWREGPVEVYEGREFSFAMPFALATRDHSPAEGDSAGPFTLGIMLANFYSSFWSTSNYPAPQSLVFDLDGATSIAVPALDSSPGRGGLARDTFLEVVERMLGGVREYPPGEQDYQVRWGRADTYHGDGRSLLGYVTVDLPDSLWWEGRQRRHVIAASLLDLNRINDYEQTLARPLFGELSLLAPDGRQLLGPPRDARLADGLSLGTEGMLFKLHSQAHGGWVAVYGISYALFFRNLKWILLSLPALLLVGLAGGWYCLRWYSRRVVGPASVAHRQVVESDAFSRTVIDTAPVALCVLGCEGRQLVIHNQLAAQWLGSEADILDLARGWHMFDGAWHNGEVCMRNDGRYLQASFAATRYHGEDALLCVFRDITAYQQAQGALAEAKRAADSANAAKTLFLASMSHEIRTPLYGVLGTLELLALTDLDVQQRGYLQAIQGSSTTLLQLISDILDVSKIEAGQMLLTQEDFSPLELAEEVMRGFAVGAAAKHLQWYACIDAEVPARLYGDAARLRQVLNNLLSNALKFTDVGRVVLRLKVLGRSGRQVQLQWQVTDTGIGIPEHLQPRLFEPFFQIADGQGGLGGTGLGLAICWRLTQLMGGELRVVSEPGLGSSFSLFLGLPDSSDGSGALADVQLQPGPVYLRSPLRELASCLEAWLQRWGCVVLPGEPPAGSEATAVLLEVFPETLAPCDWRGPRVRVAADAAGQPQYERGVWSVSPLSLRGIAQALALAQNGEVQLPAVAEPPRFGKLGLRVLVAEDNPINQVLLREQLEELGCEVRLASDGKEALLQFEGESFDVLLTDVNMPRCNGYQLTRELRERGVDIPIIGVTANAMREEGERCQAVGMNAWLVKPLSLRLLYDALRGLAAATRAPLAGPGAGSEAPAAPAPEALQVPAHMRELFVETMRNDLQAAEQASAEGDVQALGQALHRMAGALAVVRGQALVRSCRLLEEGLGEGRVQSDDPRVARLLARIGRALGGL